MTLLDRDLVLRALAELDEELRRRDVRGVVHLVGGAAMLLTFGERPATRDLDAVWQPDTPVRQAAWSVADRLGLPRSWLNDQASIYFSRNAEPGRTAYQGSHLQVVVSPPQHLLAMKVMASRPAADADDIATLIAHLGLRDRDEVLAIVRAHFPDDEVPPRALDLLDDILAADARAPRRTADPDRPSPAASPGPRCGRPMKRVPGTCSRPAGHDGACRR